MRGMLALLTVGLLGLCIAACGGVVKGSAPAVPFPSGTIPVHGGYIKGDQDGDANDLNDPDDADLRGYGRPASTADERAVTGLLEHYYAAAAAGDGAMACSLTSAGLAKSAHLVNAVAEDYEPIPGSPSLRGKNCVAVMSVLTKERHEELVADVDTLVLTGMRTRGSHGLAFLGFRTTSERVIPLERDRGVWKVDGLFDSAVP